MKGNLLKTLTNFINDRKQRVVLNGWHSKWANVEAEIPQAWILGPLPLIHINDLPDNITSNPKLFTDGILLYWVLNFSFPLKLESIQYNSALAITTAIRETSTEKLYNELSLKSLEKRRWYKKLCCPYKAYKNHSPKYLFNIVPVTVSRLTQEILMTFLYSK